MIIIYNCYGGTHSSILSSAIHLKMLPEDRVPSKQEILAIPYFNQLEYRDMGRLIFHGTDEDGNRVYTVGRGTSKALVPAIRHLTTEFKDIYGIKDNFIFSNTSGTVPLSMTFGGFFSRGLGIDFLGVPLLALGARRNYNKLLEVVHRTKKYCREDGTKFSIIDIDQKGQPLMII